MRVTWRAIIWIAFDRIGNDPGTRDKSHYRNKISGSHGDGPPSPPEKPVDAPQLLEADNHSIGLHRPKVESYSALQ